jgi:pyrroline-5-carboxylate reductase
MKLVFYGAGNMAQAIFTGIINSNNLNANDIYLTNKSNEQALKSFAEKLGVNYSYDDEALLKEGPMLLYLQEI